MPKRKANDKLSHNTKRPATDPSSHNAVELYWQSGNAGRSALTECTTDLEESKFQDAIDHASSAITDLLDSLLHTLDIRAKTYGHVMQFNEAFRDAYHMIRYAPTKAIGYLRIGELYLLQCRQRAAMRIYQQGIDTIPKEQTDELRKLSEKYQVAKTELDRRVDFITRLPYDLMCVVLDRLTTDHLVQMLKVGKSWRDRIAEYPKPWRTILLSDCDSSEQDKIEALMSALPIVSRHIKKIRSCNLTSDQCERLFTMIINGTFSKLEILHFSLCRMNNYCRCMLALWQTKDTLQEFCIVTADEDSPVVPVGVILSTCRKLQRLTCRQRRVIASVEGLSATPIPPISPLVELNLDYAQIDTIVLEPVLRSCRNVRKLDIHSCQVAMIDLVRSFCPKVENLTINVTARDTPSATDDNYTHLLPAITTKPTGVYCIMMHLSQERNAEKPIQLIADNAEALDELSLTLPSGGVPNLVQQWNPLATLAFTNLSKLGLTFSFELNDVVASVIRNSCPVLRSLFIGNSENISASVLQAIPQLTTLRILILAQVSQVDEQAMIDMFQSFARRRRRRRRGEKMAAAVCSLRTFELLESEFQVSDAILQALANVPTLERIHMADLTTVECSTFENFTRALRDQAPPLHTIEFSDLECVSDDAVNHLCNIESLRKVELYGLKNVTYQSVKNFNKNIKVETDIAKE
ncbi:hypothetical protein BDA99DRAFT_556482 [Phascolomyces articulosus]|uniref:F-box domain-containing protein n=1 Tax=Phascolomyces articulosus TaxID=60185 RepID=A0AAD5KPG6_9FUNG|nr:hypothetical protein BDA99DRAFT_556482 [Phascolomyces articulosus]